MGIVCDGIVSRWGGLLGVESPGGADRPGGRGVIPGGIAGSEFVDCGRRAGDSGVGETEAASCEPDPRSDSTAIEDVGDRGG